MEDIIFKDMFIILNNENKVLTFFANDENQIKMFLPYLIDSNKLSMITSIADIILKEINMEEFECILQRSSCTSRLESRNNKLYPTKRSVDKRYYVSSKELSKNFYEELMSYCNSNDIGVDFLSFDEIRNVLSDDTYTYAYERYFRVAIDTLELKLNYSEY